MSKRRLLVVFCLFFSLASVGIMEDWQGNWWLKDYLLLGLIFWGNVLIYLNLYPRWGQRLFSASPKAGTKPPPGPRI